MSYEKKIAKLKSNIFKMMEERIELNKVEHNEVTGTIWVEALGMFEYVMHLTPKDLKNIRFHAAHLTGTNILQYYHQFPALDSEQYAKSIGYKFLTDNLPKEYWVGEPPCPAIKGSIGINYHGKIINQDICRYQSCVTNLYEAGAFLLPTNKERSFTILEIGAGHGGLAYHVHSILKGLNRKTTYIIVDLPEVLLFSGAFLTVNSPDSRIYVYSKDTFTSKFIKNGIYKYDFVLIPDFALKRLEELSKIHLVINTQSFQEMTKEQVENYLLFCKDRLTGILYSDNIDRHPFNNDLEGSTVTSLLGKHFDLFPNSKFYMEL
jgi:hypothetical protein